MNRSLSSCFSCGTLCLFFDAVSNGDQFLFGVLFLKIGDSFVNGSPASRSLLILFLECDQLFFSVVLLQVCNSIVNGSFSGGSLFHFVFDPVSHRDQLFLGIILLKTGDSFANRDLASRSLLVLLLILIPECH